MTDPLERGIARIDVPRPLDPGFRDRLERALTGAAGSERDDATRWTIDRPRQVPPRTRARVEAALIRRPTRADRLTRGLASAIAAALVASAVLVVADRMGASRSGGRDARPVLAAPTTPHFTPSAPAARTAGSLRGFSSAGAFLRYVRGEALKLTGPYGLAPLSRRFGEEGGFNFGRTLSGPGIGGTPNPGTGAGAPAGAPLAPGTGSFSTTNIQEEGVDEPDTVKTDGRRLVLMTSSRVWLLDVTSTGARVRDSLDVPNGTGAFLAGDRVIHFASLPAAPSEAKRATHALQRPWTKVTVISITDASALEVVSSFSIEGSYVSARLAKGIVRLIVSSGALGPPPAPVPSSSSSPTRFKRLLAEAEDDNERAIRHSIVGDWMPHYVVQRAGRTALTGHVHDWSAVSRPPDRAGLGMLTVLTIDPSDPRPDNAVSVIGAGDIVYSTIESLYVTSGRLDDFLPLREGRSPPKPITRIHKFDVRDPGRARYVGSGEVPGYLLNQFSLSEHEGHLRAASTLATGARGGQSFVTVLAHKAGRLVPVGSLGNLGVGERIYSVRFIGTKGYVVTFRLLDPLHVIDLRVPERPRLRGELKVPGYSGYLHPLSDTLLLGIGRDAEDNGVAKGLQFSLFDVSNPAKPTRRDVSTFGIQGSSTVENDHHGFLYWAPRRLVVVPATIVDREDPGAPSRPFIGALALTVARDTLGTPKRLTHVGRSGSRGYEHITRAFVVGGRLLTFSDAGLLVSDVRTLADRSWIPLAG